MCAVREYKCGLAVAVEPACVESSCAHLPPLPLFSPSSLPVILALLKLPVSSAQTPVPTHFALHSRYALKYS